MAESRDMPGLGADAGQEGRHTAPTSLWADLGIPVHYVDLKERPASKGELRRFADRFGAAALIDKEGARYKAMGLRVALDSPARLLERALTEPRLLRTPLVRHGGKVTIGHAPDDWQAWVDAARSQ